MSATAHAIRFHGCVSHNRFRTPAAVVADCSVHNIAVTAAEGLQRTVTDVDSHTHACTYAQRERKSLQILLLTSSSGFSKMFFALNALKEHTRVCMYTRSIYYSFFSIF